jgi:hypothetical protein
MTNIEKLQSVPHCGACFVEFSSVDELASHLDNCEAARALLLPVTALMLGAADPTHRAAHLAQSIPLARAELVEYARAVANETRSWDRSVIHRRLCDRLGIDYAAFRPFESEEITEVPNEQQALDILYRTLGVVLRDLIISK